MSDFAIKLSNVSKKFDLPHEKKTSSLNAVLNAISGENMDITSFKALDKISFSVKKGESVGILGKNGSGKSTLLKLVAKILGPSTGKVEVQGRIVPFIELGVGFQPDLSARENVFLYGAIMGLSHAQIKKRYDKIVEFAELEKFMDMKLKDFSSGMQMRLAFATAINTDPDILLVDEVLAVGDEAFKCKCIDKIMQLKRKKKTILFVSHSLELVKQVCNRCVLLDGGKLVSAGTTSKVANVYLKLLSNQEDALLIKQNKESEKELDLPTRPVVVPKTGIHPVNVEPAIQTSAKTVEPTKIKTDADRWGSKEIKITKIRFFGKNKKEKISFDSNEHFSVELNYKVIGRVKDPSFGINIYTPQEVCLFVANTSHFKPRKWPKGSSGKLVFDVKELHLAQGKYFLEVSVYDRLPNTVKPLDVLYFQYHFKVTGKKAPGGLIVMPNAWNFVDKK
ncbi:MAG: ABC transporter ATP-binding protein [Candidatus Micrarchaeia archaeon]